MNITVTDIGAALLKQEAAKLFTRPFNLEHAKAGAPYALATGEGVEIVKWDRKHAQCLVTVSKQDAAVRTYRADGTQGHGDGKFDLVMTPLGYIDGKPVFVGDKVYSEREAKCKSVVGQEYTVSEVTPNWYGGFDDCRWPAPEKQYPVTGMDAVELVRLHGATLNKSGPDGGRHSAVLAVANAALRHAVDNGYLMLPGGKMSREHIDEAFAVVEKRHGLAFGGQARDYLVDVINELMVTEPEVDQLRADLARKSEALGKAERLLEELGYRFLQGEWRQLARIGERAARDMAIADAVHRAVVEKVCFGFEFRNIDLAAIIAKVQP
jgi:hypothetical protein